MDKPKVLYRVHVSVSYHKMEFIYGDIRDAEYLTDAILFHLDRENSDEVKVAIYPELPEPEEEQKEEEDE